MPYGNALIGKFLTNWLTRWLLCRPWAMPSFKNIRCRNEIVHEVSYNVVDIQIGELWNGYDYSMAATDHFKEDRFFVCTVTEGG